MKNSTLKILFAIFILLSLAATYPYWQKFLLPKKTAWPSELQISKFTADNTQTIILKNKNTEIKLEKKGTDWKVNDFPASNQTLANFFQALSSLELGTLVSKNSQNHQEYGVDNENGLFLTLKTSSEEKTIIIGNFGQEVESFYCRGKDNPYVYLLKGPLKSRAFTTLLDWRDKEITNLSADQTAKIVVSGKNNFTLTKKDNQWEISSLNKNKKLEENEVNSLFSHLSPLEANDFLNDKEKQEFTKLSSSKQAIKITFLDKEEKTLAQLSLVEKEGDFWVKESNKAEIFKVYSYKLSPLLNLQEKIK